MTRLLGRRVISCSFAVVVPIVVNWGLTLGGQVTAEAPG